MRVRGRRRDRVGTGQWNLQARLGDLEGHELAGLKVDARRVTQLERDGPDVVRQIVDAAHTGQVVLKHRLCTETPAPGAASQELWAAFVSTSRSQHSSARHCRR